MEHTARVILAIRHLHPMKVAQALDVNTVMLRELDDFKTEVDTCAIKNERHFAIWQDKHGIQIRFKESNAVHVVDEVVRPLIRQLVEGNIIDTIDSPLIRDEQHIFHLTYPFESDEQDADIWSEIGCKFKTKRGVLYLHTLEPLESERPKTDADLGFYDVDESAPVRKKKEPPKPEPKPAKEKVEADVDHQKGFRSRVVKGMRLVVRGSDDGLYLSTVLSVKDGEAKVRCDDEDTFVVKVNSKKFVLGVGVPRPRKSAIPEDKLADFLL